MSELVKRERLALRVRPTMTTLMLVVVRAELTAERMVSLVRESGTGVESSTINSRLTLVYPGVMRGAALVLADFFLVVVVVHCWAWRLGVGGPEFATSAKVALAALGAGGGRIGAE